MSASPEARETIGNYVIERPLAHGSMGHVYVARHTLTYARVALKVLRDDLAADAQAEERFLREVRAAAQIGHDGIVKVHDAGRSADGRLYLAMELLSGETLEDRMQHHPGERLMIMDWLLCALPPLAAAHAQGIVHRDLKPANVFIAQAADGSEHLKLLDFGLARDTRQKSGTETGIALGTPYYMSPEQATRPKHISPASDVWSMGVMMYEVLSGHMPFDGETLHAVVINASTTPHLPLAQRVPDLDPRLCQLVEDCLSKDPGQRPADASALLARLAPLLQVERLRQALHQPVHVVRPTHATGLTPEQIPYADTAISFAAPRLYDSHMPHTPKREKRGLWLPALVIVLLVGSGFVWIFSRAPAPEPAAAIVPPTAAVRHDSVSARVPGAGAAAPAQAIVTTPVKKPAMAVKAEPARIVKPQPTAAETKNVKPAAGKPVSAAPGAEAKPAAQPPAALVEQPRAAVEQQPEASPVAEGAQEPAPAQTNTDPASSAAPEAPRADTPPVEPPPSERAPEELPSEPLPPPDIPEPNETP